MSTDTDTDTDPDATAPAQPDRSSSHLPLDTASALAHGEWAALSTYRFLTSGSEERDLLGFLVLPVLLLRLLYAQLWITVSRCGTGS